jgi:hypothetical protein
MALAKSGHRSLEEGEGDVGRAKTTVEREAALAKLGAALGTRVFVLGENRKDDSSEKGGLVSGALDLVNTKFARAVYNCTPL